ncbi:alkaline phosphatase family protein, partial [Leucobacter sp. M11]|uniref:alkaline phosphatase family protein n=1 Tax=Leucobacter sp. M11 TaxID=2993565 RepID=UPI002D801A02
MVSFLRPIGALTVGAALCAGLISLPPTAAAQALGGEHNGLPSGALTQKSIVIGVDGLTYAELDSTDTPNLDRLRAGGMLATSNLFAAPLAPTVSGPAWASIATGTWPDRHGTTNNDFTGTQYERFPDYLSRAEAGLPEVSTLAVGTWGPITSKIFGPAVDVRVAGGGDAGTTKQAVDFLTNGNPDATFVHLDEVDGAGHSAGTNGAGYGPAVTRADAMIGEILAAIDARPSRAQEDWQVIVTSDHGHTPTGGHGGNSVQERQTFVVVSGGGQAPGSERFDVKLTDIAPSVLRHLGVASDPAWGLDGQNFADLRADDFDSLRGILQPAVDERGPGAQLGWTGTAPEGWSIDNSRMPEGGVTEFRGWSFMTDEFFSNVERGQGRETNVRSRDVFAVADSDEWDDSAHAAGAFDSTLRSPKIALNGADTLDLSYATTYLWDGPQAANVTLVFPDNPGLEELRVRTFEREPVNAVETFATELPRDDAGQLPTSAQLEFRYTGTNSMFWAVDQVRWSQPDAPVTPEVPGPWATVTLDTARVAPGDTLTATVTGLAAGQQIRATLRPLEIEAQRVPVADAEGRVSLRIPVPRAARPGEHRLEVTADGEDPITTPVTVTAGDPEPGTGGNTGNPGDTGTPGNTGNTGNTGNSGTSDPATPMPSAEPGDSVAGDGSAARSELAQTGASAGATLPIVLG